MEQKDKSGLLKKQAAKRGTDYVSWLAVILLVLIIIGEIAFSVWLPIKMRSAKAWEKEALLEEVIEMVDSLRGLLKGLSEKKPETQREIDQAMKCLDEYANYLRKNKAMMSMEQIIQMHTSLKQFNDLFVAWKIKSNFVFEEQLDTKAFIAKTLGEYEKEMKTIK